VTAPGSGTGHDEAHAQALPVRYAKACEPIGGPWESIVGAQEPSEGALAPIVDPTGPIAGPTGPIVGPRMRTIARTAPTLGTRGGGACSLAAMRAPLLLAAATLATLAACAQTPPLPPPLPASVRRISMRDVSFPMRDLRFPSGLRVVVEEDHRAPTVAVTMLVGAGSAADPEGKEGLAHYVEHLTFRSRPDGRHTIGQFLDRAGAGASNATTGWDATRYFEVGPKEALPAFLTLEGVRLRAPIANVAPEVAAVERDVVRNELRERNETGYDGPILGYLQQALFPREHPYSRPVIGTLGSLATLTPEDAQQFVARHYRPDNVTIVVVGDVDLTSAARVVEESLPRELLVGTADRSPRLDPVPPEPPLAPAAALLQRTGPVAGPELWIGWTVPRSFDADAWLERFARATVNSVLHRAQASLVAGKLASMFVVRRSLADGAEPGLTADQIIDGIERMWERPRQTERGQKIEDVLFVRRRLFALTGALLGGEDILSRSLERADFAHFARDPAAYSRTLLAIAETDKEKIQAFTSRWLTRERARTLLVTPEEGGVAPPEDAELRVAPGGRDHAPPADDAATIHGFVRPPGVTAYRRVVLQNGLEVIAGRRAGLPLVSATLSFHGGAASAPRAGIAEAAVHASYVRSTEMNLVLEAGYGGHYEDRVRPDRVDLAVEGPAGNLEAILDDLAREPARRAGGRTVSAYTVSVIPTLRRAEGLPEGRAERAFARALHGASPYGRVVGSADFEGFDLALANTWLDRTLVPRNAVLVIVGEIGPDDAITLANERFGRWASDQPEVPAPPPPAPPPTRPAPVVVLRPGATQGEIRVGCLLPAGSSPARRDLGAALLEERVSAVIRGTLGASYGFHARAVSLRGGVVQVTLDGAADNAHLGQALEIVRRALDDLAAGRVEAADVQGIRRRVALRYAVRFGTNDAVARAILAARNEGRSLASVDAYPEDLLAVDAAALTADFAACARGAVLSIVGDEAALRPAVASAWR
jgi:zinc protease